MRKLFVAAAAIIGLAALPAAAVAAPIVGQLSLSGSSVFVDGTTIDWGNDGPTSGSIGVVTPSTGYFGAGGPYGSLVGFTDVLLDLDQASFPAGPVGTFAPLDEFETVEGTGLNFTLTAIDQCGDSAQAACPFGDTSPFALFEFGGSTTVDLSMRGTVVDPIGAPGELSTWVGTFSADFPDTTIAELVAQFATDGFIVAPYSAAKFTVDVPNEVPEPASMLLLGSGLVGLAAARRRRNRK